MIYPKQEFNFSNTVFYFKQEFYFIEYKSAFLEAGMYGGRVGEME
jgi:hypothetical protein